MNDLCFFCERKIAVGDVFVCAEIQHRHGEILSRRYQKSFHRPCFKEFSADGKKPDSETQFVAGYHELDVIVRGARVAPGGIGALELTALEETGGKAASGIQAGRA